MESVDAMEGLDGRSIEDAKDALSKRKVQKKENRVFDMLPESKMTFDELKTWYLELESVKKLASFNRVQTVLGNFNDVFGSYQVADIKQTDIENYQIKRKEQGRADATIDMEIKYAQTAVTKAFDNDMLAGRCLKAFRRSKRLLKKGSNARDRILGFDEYLELIEVAPFHLAAMIKIAFNTGMRAGEIRQLKWSYIDRENGFIRLPAKLTKENKPKTIPINQNIEKLLRIIPRAINHGYVITYNGKRIRKKDGYKRSFITACKNAKIPCGRKAQNGIVFHDIRRTVKTNMLSAGVDKAHRDFILGHSLHGMDAHYLKPTDETLKEAMEKYTIWLNNQLEVNLENVDHSVDQMGNN
jgi:integrase